MDQAAHLLCDKRTAACATLDHQTIYTFSHGAAFHASMPSYILCYTPLHALLPAMLACRLRGCLLLSTWI